MNRTLTTGLLMLALTGWAQPWPASDPSNSNGWIPFAPMTDEFEGTQLDQTKWWPTTLYWQGRQPVFHNPNNNAVTGGELVLTLNSNTTGVPAGYDYSSGYIQSKSVRRYLYVEIRAKALNNSIMTTFWLNGAHSTWGREIDIVECRPGVTGKEREYFSNFHIWRTPTSAGVDSTYSQDPAIQTLPFNMLEDYHVYGFEWDRDWMKIYVDGNLIRQRPTGSFTLAQWVLVGNEFNAYFSPMVDPNRLPATYNIDYVRAWILPENPTTYYVDRAGGKDANSGLSWAEAKKTIRAAVDASYDGDSIYVAQGKYTEYVTIWGTRNYSLYGGFLPGQTFEQRNPTLHPCVIQAPPDGYTVLELRSGENIRIDGFTLTGSIQDFESGVMIEGPLTNTVFANCRIVKNRLRNGSGGGASIIGPDAPSYVRFEDCEFSNNSSMGLYAGGGALRTADDSRATFLRCLFAHNEATGPGSAAHIYWTSPGTMMRFENCIFRDNIAPVNAGTLDLNSGSLEVIHCTFGSQSGDGIRLPNENTANQRSLVVINTIVEGMTGDGLDIGWGGASAITTLRNSLFNGNSAQLRYAGTTRNTASAINGLAWASGNLVSDPLFRSRYDYRLAPGSLARNGGSATGASTNDFDRVARPLDGGYDIGAYESTGLEPLQRPFALTPQTVPGRIEAEHYDLGGEGVAYHDTTPEPTGGRFRLDDVDIEFLPGFAGWFVGFVSGGEWLEFTADVAGGIYELTVRVANANAPTTLRLQVDGATLVTADVPTTSSWNSLIDIVIPVVALGNGSNRLLRVEFDAAVNLDWIEFAVPAVPPMAPTLAWALTDNNLNFQWTGNGFRVQSQTNSTGLGTNWFDVPNGSRRPVSVPLPLEAGSAFFRLAPQ